jgi:hypothetical protein
MTERPWQNVWAEIVSKAREHMVRGEPIRTLDRDLANMIIDVGPNGITRRSEAPRSVEGSSTIRSSDVGTLWTQLLEQGQAQSTGPVAFAYALIARLIDGVRFEPDPYRLEFSDRDAAMTPWRGSAIMHLLLKWSPTRRGDTIEQHKRIADESDFVWWGMIATSPPAEQRLSWVRLQLDGGADVFAYLYETGSPPSSARCTRARIIDFTTDRSAINEAQKPTYYNSSECACFFALADFDELPPGWVSENLALLKDMTVPVPDGALQNQSVPVYVTNLVPVAGGPPPHVWWVNQGATYAAESAGGYLWAPSQTQAGYSVLHHTNVARLMPGNVIVHYANGAIRALGLVKDWPELRSKPRELSGGPWGEDGHYASAQYFPLVAPILIQDVPNRTADAGPFTTGGDVKQGYLFPLETSFANKLHAAFLDRWPSKSPWHRDGPSPAYWVFRTAPNDGDLVEALKSWRVGEEDTWIASRYRADMQPGDVVALWSGGGQAGIHAVELTGIPYLEGAPIGIPMATTPTMPPSGGHH